MNNDSKPTAADSTPPLEPAAAPGMAEAAPQAEPIPKHHDDIIAELRREVSDLKDRFLRAHADVENIRKRTEREKEDTAKYAIGRFANDVLAVGDNFQRALGAVPAGAAEADPALKALVEGVSLTEREFLNVLERHGVTRMDPLGGVFNPHLHQAVMEVPKPDVAAGTIVQVFQAGYTIEERLLRPAMVVVATGGFKPMKMPGAAAGEAVADWPPAAAEPSGPPEPPEPSTGDAGAGESKEPPGFGRRTTPPGGGSSGA